MPAMTFEQIITKAEAPTGCGVLVLRDGKVLTGTRIDDGYLVIEMEERP